LLNRHYATLADTPQPRGWGQTSGELYLGLVLTAVLLELPDSPASEAHLPGSSQYQVQNARRTAFPARSSFVAPTNIPKELLADHALDDVSSRRSMCCSRATRRSWSDACLSLTAGAAGCLFLVCLATRAEAARFDDRDLDAAGAADRHLGQDHSAEDAGLADAAVGDAGPSPPAALLPPLPPVSPGPDLSPVIEGPPADPTTEPMALRERPKALLKVIVGLVALLALAYLGGHPSVQRLEERLGISQVITAGFPFVLLGLIARHRAAGILNDEVLAQLSPLLRLGLGWIGFTVGFRLDARSLDRLPPRPLVAVASLAAAPFGIVLAGTALLLAITSRLPGSLRDPVFLRDAIILGSAAASTASVATRLLPTAGARRAATEAVGRLLRLEDAAAILGLAVVAAYFRPRASTASWQLPGTAWLFLTLGLGMAAGLIMYILLRLAKRSADPLIVSLGAILFAAGFAGNLRLSPVVVCFVMGLLVTNAPGDYKSDLQTTLARLERPLYFLFLLIVGAVWDLGDWRGWALMVVFAGGRLLGKMLGVHLASSASDLHLSLPERRTLAVAPLGALALAVVISAQLLYPGGSISLIVTAIVGGAVATEVLVQLATRHRNSARSSASEGGR
jgi:hypothetical protein